MLENTGLCDAFLSAVPDAAAFRDRAELARNLGELYEASRASWPDIVLDPASYARHLAANHAGGALPATPLAVDLYLACACANATPGALEAFERQFGDLMVRAITRVDGSRAFVDDTLQVLRRKLFVPETDAPPQISGYAGRAPLRSWLVSAALRTALKLRRRRDDRGHDTLPPNSDLLGAGPSPELDYVRRTYGAHFEAAIRKAAACIPAKDRTILKLHLGEKMSIDRLGALYHVGRSTAARWLAKARASLQEATRTELCASLGITHSEYDSLAEAVRSQLEVSLIRYLEHSPEGRAASDDSQ